MNAIENRKSGEGYLFEPLDFFMLRTPLLSVEFFKELFDIQKYDESVLTAGTKEELKVLFKKDLFRDIISTTSPTLQAALDKFETESSPEKKKIMLQSFMKYLIRMSTRPTPFGLLAGVSTGRLGNGTRVRTGPDGCHVKRARPDMEWLMGVVNKLEKRMEVVERLRVRANTSVLLSGDRLEIPYITHYGQQGLENGMESVSIRATRVVQYTLEQAKSFIAYSELLDRLKVQYPETAGEKIRSFLWQLFQNEFLISELRPPLMICSPFDYVMEKLATVEPAAQELAELKEISELLARYNATKPGEGMDIFATLSGKMDSIYKVGHPVQVDLAAATEEVVLNRTVANELAKAAECLWRLSPESTCSSELKKYRMEFIEKYGVYREIPVLELLDNDRGLGAPPNYVLPKGRMEPGENEIPLSVRKFESFMLNTISRAIRDKKHEIEITPEMLEKLEPVKPDYSLAPLSIELYFSIAASRQEDIDNGNFEIVLGPNFGSQGAGKSFGRFMDILEPGVQKELHRIGETEKASMEDCIFAEIVFLPGTGRNANVVISENIRDYEVVIGTNASRPEERTLPMSDLLIGATQDRFYIKSSFLNKRVVITTGHMLNARGTPNVYRFLREVSNDGVRDLCGITFGNFARAPFLPQIRFGKVILSPAKWGLSLGVLGTTKDGLKKDFKSLIHGWREEWKVPRFVYMTEYDNRILLDLEHPLHQEVLMDELAHKEEDNVLEIVGMGNDLSKIWVQGAPGTYVSEFVLPFMRSKDAVLGAENAAASKDEAATVLRYPVPDTFRVFYPGSEWLYLKLYGNSNREDEFIAFELDNFCKSAVSQGLISQFFFVRYKDNEPHIRLRFRGEPEQLTTGLMPRLNQWFQRLSAAGLLSRAAVDTYERELERYGGPELIERAEELFYHDSMTAAGLLFLKRSGALSVDFDIAAAASVLHLLENLGLTFEEQLGWLDSAVAYKDYQEEFRQFRRLLMEIGDSANQWEALQRNEKCKGIFDKLSLRKDAVTGFAAALEAAEAENRLWNRKTDIVGSIVHLHCNRLVGTDREHEKKITALARHTLNSLKHFRREKGIL